MASAGERPTSKGRTATTRFRGRLVLWRNSTISHPAKGEPDAPVLPRSAVSLSSKSAATRDPGLDRHRRVRARDPSLRSGWRQRVPGLDRHRRLRARDPSLRSGWRQRDPDRHARIPRGSLASLGM